MSEKPHHQPEEAHQHSKETTESPGVVVSIFSWLKKKLKGVLGDSSVKENTAADHKENMPWMTVKIIGKCKNEGDNIGLTKGLQQKLGLKPGDTAHILVGGAPSLVLTVEDISPELYNESMGDNVVTTNFPDQKVGGLITLAKPPHKADVKKAA